MFGLATPGGLVSGTGVAGFTLGGGIGWLARQHGLACDNLVGAEVVTASGSIVHVGGSENPELLWALRGGGGNFGVVSSFEFQLHEVGPVVYGGALFYPRSRAVELLGKYASFAAGAPEPLTTLVAMVTGPPAPFLPPEFHGQPMIAFAACFNGAAKDGEKALAPLRASLGTPTADLVGPLPYTALQSMFDPSAPPGRLHYWKSHRLAKLTQGAAEALVQSANAARSPFSEMHLHQLGGQAAREPAGGAAFSNRNAAFVVNIIAQWADPAGNDVNIQWARESWERIRPHATGSAYVNFLAESEPDAVRAAYGAAEYDRLASIKAKLDPDELFRATHRIPPRSVDR
jgi:FAD/FMN-containing dehydrogenase